MRTIYTYATHPTEALHLVIDLQLLEMTVKVIVTAYIAIVYSNEVGFYDALQL